MATGTGQGTLGNAVPTRGESEIVGQTAADDILTITEAASHTGDPLVISNSALTELFVINKDGDIATITNFADDVALEAGKHVTLLKTDQTTFGRLRLPVLSTAPSSAAVALGDIWLAKPTTDVVRIAACVDGTNTVKYGPRMIRNTLGSASN